MEQSEYLEKRFARNPSMVFRKVADEFILVPIRRKTGDLQSIYAMDEVAGRIWELIDGQRRVGDIRDAIVEEFEVGVERAEKDLVALLRQLEEISAVQVV